jgi:hypothetical protein
MQTSHIASAGQYAPLTAELCYLKPGSERPYSYLYERPDGNPAQNWERDRRSVPIADARSLALSIDREGFELREAPSTVTDFSDESQIQTRYYPEIVRLAITVTGASQAFVFDHQVRRHCDVKSTLPFGRGGKGPQPGPAVEAHNDYTEESGRRRLDLLLEQCVRPFAIRRYAIVNIWRSIAGPVHDVPLALADARTVASHDLVPAEQHYPKRVGEIYLLRYSAEQRWYYFSGMDGHEALIFKQYDSSTRGVARFTPHAAFAHPLAPANARKRESIEVRCLVAYE